MAYIIKITPKTSEEGPTFKLNRDRSIALPEDIAHLANDHQQTLIENFGYQLLNCYVKLKDDLGWKLICDIKLTIRK